MLVGHNTKLTLGENQILRVVLTWEKPPDIYSQLPLQDFRTLRVHLSSKLISLGLGTHRSVTRE